jgi:exodeoxyribonuclease V alpha subunit
MHDAIVQLQQSYRFAPGSGLGAISREVNSGDGAQALDLIKSGVHKDVVWRDVPQAADFPRAIKDRILKGYGTYLDAGDPGEVLRRFDRFRILCAHREGPFGVGSLNALAEYSLMEQKIINPITQWYRGRPLLITANDYQLGLFNGDVGIVFPDPRAGHELRAFFSAPDGSLRNVHPLRLPEHETVYAMTVHKSQGSEFDDVLFVLPDRPSPVLTRELVYTGMTRAKTSIEIWGTTHVFLTAVSCRIERSSGLRNALWGKRT